MTITQSLERSATDDEIRAFWVTLHKDGLGVAADNPQLYAINVVTSIDDLTNPAIYPDVFKESSCGWYMRRRMQLFFEHADLKPWPVFEVPYIAQRAVSDVKSLGGASNSWVTYSRAYPDTLPQRGDMPIIEGPEHVFGVTDIEPPWTVGGISGDYETAQGGERTPAGIECIASVKRRASTARGLTFDGRPALGWVDCVKLTRWAFARG